MKSYSVRYSRVYFDKGEEDDYDFKELKFENETQAKREFNHIIKSLEEKFNLANNLSYEEYVKLLYDKEYDNELFDNYTNDKIYLLKKEDRFVITRFDHERFEPIVSFEVELREKIIENEKEMGE